MFTPFACYSQVDLLCRCGRREDSASEATAESDARPRRLNTRTKAAGMKINLRTQIARVIAAQGLSRADAADQINGRIYEARLYLKAREAR